MTQNPNISISVFLGFCKKKLNWVFSISCFFASCVITLAQIKIYTWLVPQNDRLNLNFVKDEHVVGKKTARYGHKFSIYQLLFFGSSPNLHAASNYIWGHNCWTNQSLDQLSPLK